ncbi:SDR family NAD(P)-dependent oxidoreductase [Paraburkholderia caballeronis]|uniref:NAD(P)-dependent dehydrogenase, short-chain alcohol dehydrogenase family n=1 Tax=Paraburkholderia caballeronis TaxID=416943 RepID=A0A1H7M4X5_9BURK|nr:SDR family NAD(P)-dependent oxidoreductase [Paraburkholderia caballeronis]PXW28706.1 NAD(P)-dependent dehydrogenase (short-subunit alcohol dehydrogenase family) [Paraburkholderia caballeronis]PXX04072.1 NAD(P)-dependent dehydrogenase (short-subunit alcohol dehydrogenase family) [Paraburkholderia caballeronis]RAK04816.1 NAD(P)-dependent dehydrogenase (short-subunit alcohol dehydrogenase family) [Paraburkholderia caballeronis]SED63433.1 NAD(P)-dependent dehydrogenase, short-chain alcohol dehyd
MSLTPQHPIGSGFTAASTTSHVIRGISLVGKVAIVTGGYSGLGRETVRTFLSAGARVIVPARDVARAKQSLESLPAAEVEPMDLLDAASIDAFAKRFVLSGLPLDMLVNSAGIMALPGRTLDAHGHELQFATNHLGHFRLTARLWPALKRTGSARVVSVSSMGHRFSPVVFDDLDFEHRPYNPWAGYGQSKTANILFASELDARGQADGVRAFSLHPGGIPGTGLERHVPVRDLIDAGVIDENGAPLIDPARDIKSIPMGAATQVWCATSPQLDGMGGVFCVDSDIAPLLDANPTDFSIAENQSGKRSNGVAPFAADRDAAARLWEVSERLTGVRFPD